MVINNLKRYGKNKVSDSIPTKLENLRLEFLSNTRGTKEALRRGDQIFEVSCLINTA